jgi:hypothetical protein
MNEKRLDSESYKLLLYFNNDYGQALITDRWIPSWISWRPLTRQGGQFHIVISLGFHVEFFKEAGAEKQSLIFLPARYSRDVVGVVAPTENQRWN